jgi:hopanoid C-2 methylase
MRSPIAAQNVRRVLCVFPAYAPAFGTFSHALRLVGAKAFMPPQGLLPKTPLWDRLARDGRLVAASEVEASGRESNIRFRRPHDEVVATWRRCIAYAYNPERLYARFIHQFDATYANRLVGPGSSRPAGSHLKRGLTLLVNLLLRVGLLAAYRRPFWRMAREAIRHGQVESLFTVGFVSYHLIEFSRDALRGEQNASFYSARARETNRSAQAIITASNHR